MKTVTKFEVCIALESGISIQATCRAMDDNVDGFISMSGITELKADGADHPPESFKDTDLRVNRNLIVTYSVKRIF
ncbi:hypothetical protein N9980_00595 [bacterium]|nr:hypothetical protein [bacterium]